MKQPTFCGRELLPLSVIEAARAGDPLAVERVFGKRETRAQLAQRTDAAVIRHQRLGTGLRVDDDIGPQGKPRGQVGSGDPARADRDHASAERIGARSCRIIRTHSQRADVRDDAADLIQRARDCPRPEAQANA